MISLVKKCLSWAFFLHGKCTLMMQHEDGVGVGVVLVSPHKHILPFSFALTQSCSNNVAECQALILGLQMALEMGIKDLDVYGDSQLVIN